MGRLPNSRLTPGLKTLSLAVICCFATSFSALASQPPTQEQLEQYRKDGTLAERIRRAKRIGDDKINPALVINAENRLRRILGLQPRLMAPPPAWTSGLQSKGTVKILALCISFPDYPESNPISEMEDKIFGDGDPANSPYESVRNFYLRSSYNQLTIQGNMLGWTQMPFNRNDMVIGDTDAEHDAARENLIMTALNYWDAQGHDFSQYDNNGDGRIDHFMVIWTGPNSGWMGFWWAYNTTWTMNHSFTIDGKTLGNYSWSFESRYEEPVGQPGNFTPRIIIHETGHALGLPDYYDYDDNVGPSGGVGGLDMMDSNWGDHNAFSKFLLDWITPTVYTAGTFDGLTLRASDSYSDAIIVMPDAIQGDQFSEYFVIQNRNQAGNDSDTPAKGILIWHVDARLDAAHYNYLYNNSYSAHKLLRLMEADGLEEIETANPPHGGWANEGDYYAAGMTFGPDSTPNSHRYDGSDTGITVNNISQPGETITFDLRAFGFSVGSVTAVNNTTVDILFNQEVDNSPSAATVTNYTIDNGIGHPSGIAVLPDDKTVRLTFSALTECIIYSLTIENVKSNENMALNPDSSPAEVILGAHIYGSIASDTTWTAAEGPYCILDDVEIMAWATLTIQAGTTIKVKPNVLGADKGLNDAADLIVAGKLLIQGTADSPVVMTSSAFSPAVNDWGTILFYDTAQDSSSISFLQSSYSKYGVYIFASSPTVQNSVFSNCGQDCIYLENSNSLVLNNTFLDTNAVYFAVGIDSGAPVIQGNDFTGCPAEPQSCIGAFLSTQAVIRNNRIHSANRGIILVAPATLAGNDLEGLTTVGIALNPGSEAAVIKDNNIRNCNFGIYSWDAQGSATHNYFSNNTENSGADGNKYFSIDYPLASPADWKLAISSISLKTDDSYAIDLGAYIQPNSTLYIQLDGTDGDPSAANLTVVKITSDMDPTGVFAVLTETSADSGVYRATAVLDSGSNQASDPVKIAAANENVITIASVRDQSKSDSVTVGDSPEILGITGKIQSKVGSGPTQDIPNIVELPLKVYDQSGAVLLKTETLETDATYFIDLSQGVSAPVSVGDTVLIKLEIQPGANIMHSPAASEITLGTVQTAATTVNANFTIPAVLDPETQCKTTGDASYAAENCCTVNGMDFTLLRGVYNLDCADPQQCPTDFNDDGKTNGQDFLLLKNVYNYSSCD